MTVQETGNFKTAVLKHSYPSVQGLTFGTETTEGTPKFLIPETSLVPEKERLRLNG